MRPACAPTYISREYRWWGYLIGYCNNTLKISTNKHLSFYNNKVTEEAEQAADCTRHPCQTSSAAEEIPFQQCKRLTLFQGRQGTQDIPSSHIKAKVKLILNNDVPGAEEASKLSHSLRVRWKDEVSQVNPLRGSAREALRKKPKKSRSAFGEDRTFLD